MQHSNEVNVVQTSPSIWWTIGTCSLVVSVLDGLDAVIFFGSLGVSPTKLFQYIASAVLGASSANFGIWSASLGVVLHFAVAAVLGSIYLGFARVFPVLRSRWIIAGASFGVIAYFAITVLVLPLTRAKVAAGLPPTNVLINGVLAHVFLVGIPISYVVFRAYRILPKA